jgi:hypothetical protein
MGSRALLAPPACARGYEFGERLYELVSTVLVLAPATDVVCPQ